MALHLEEVPEFRCTINLVPSLLVQIQRYVDGKQRPASRRLADAGRRAVRGRCRIYLLDHFFMANADAMIRPYPRYHELYLKRGLGREAAEAVRDRDSAAGPPRPPGLVQPDLVPPAAVRARRRARRVPAEGPGLDRGREELAARQAARRPGGDHPAAPEAGGERAGRADDHAVLSPDPAAAVGQALAREAMPGLRAAAVSRSRTRKTSTCTSAGPSSSTRELFGAPPKGMWPSEGSVSQEIIAAIADAGIEWIATDEEILMQSTDGFVSRDGQGLVTQARDAVPALARRAGREAAADRLPRPRPERPDRLPLSAERSDLGGRRHARQGRRDRPRRRRHEWATSRRSCRSSSTARTAGSTTPTAACSSSGTSISRRPCIRR